MTKLEIVKELERRYAKSRWWYFPDKQVLGTNSGICYCIDRITILRNPLFYEIRRELFLYEEIKTFYIFDYWFPPGKISPRLKIIRKYLKQLENEENSN